jgi:tripartite-type tricarboxylate transporter receptor subunit TctC
MAPKGTPPEIIEKLHAATQKAVEDPDVKNWALSVGAEMRGSSPAELSAHLKEQTAVWTKLVADLSLKAE